MVIVTQIQICQTPKDDEEGKRHVFYFCHLKWDNWGALFFFQDAKNQSNCNVTDVQ